MDSAGLGGLSILIVEDELLLRKQLAAELEALDADVTSAGTLQAAKQLIGKLSFDIALLDVNLPDGRGIELLADKLFSANTAVVVMTGFGGVSGAVEAMRLGAVDYLVKPFEPGELPLVVARVQRARQSARLEEHRRQDEAGGSDGFFFGTALVPVKGQLERILAADRRLHTGLPPVLIEGETGTGKTTIARWVHQRGPRESQPLVEMNCSAVPESLAESELFGHEHGAFTDARSARLGLFEAASGGTLFLDELPSLSLAIQAKLLTTLEDHQVRRLGSNKSISVDVRVIAATSRDLKQLVATGQFREDLFHRLDLCRIQLPPLRERGREIITLAEILMKDLCERHRFPLRRITPAGQERLLGYRWPGNVRELAHELERAIIFEDSTELDFPHLAPGNNSTGAGLAHGDDWFNEAFAFPAEGFSLESAVHRLIQHAMKQTSENVSAAARLLGVSRDYLRYHLAERKKQTVSQSDGPRLGGAGFPKVSEPE
jgi:DNA-binding NtrC family response regulator